MLGGGCSFGLVCWKGQHKDEPAVGGAGASALTSLKLPPHPWGASLGCCHLPALPQGCIDASSLLGCRRGPELDPPRWAGVGTKVACESLGAAPPAGGCFTPSTVFRGLGWVIIIMEEKYLHQMPWHVVAAHPLRSEDWCLPGAGMLWVGSGMQWLRALPGIPPPSLGEAPGSGGVGTGSSLPCQPRSRLILLLGPREPGVSKALPRPL